jgi:hypothetical protein
MAIAELGANTPGYAMAIALLWIPSRTPLMSITQAARNRIKYHARQQL